MAARSGPAPKVRVHRPRLEAIKGRWERPLGGEGDWLTPFHDFQPECFTHPVSEDAIDALCSAKEDIWWLIERLEVLLEREEKRL